MKCKSSFSSLLTVDVNPTLLYTVVIHLKSSLCACLVSPPIIFSSILLRRLTNTIIGSVLVGITHPVFVWLNLIGRPLLLILLPGLKCSFLCTPAHVHTPTLVMHESPSSALGLGGNSWFFPLKALIFAMQNILFLMPYISCSCKALQTALAMYSCLFLCNYRTCM